MEKKNQQLSRNFFLALLNLHLSSCLSFPCLHRTFLESLGTWLRRGSAVSGRHFLTLFCRTAEAGAECVTPQGPIIWIIAEDFICLFF